MNTDEWVLITEDTEDELYRLDSENYPIMIAWVFNGQVYYDSSSRFSPSFHTMAKMGNYYYCVLNKLIVK